MKYFATAIIACSVVFLLLAYYVFSFFNENVFAPGYGESDKQRIELYTAALSELETLHLNGFFNMDWCKVLDVGDQMYYSLQDTTSSIDNCTGRISRKNQGESLEGSSLDAFLHVRDLLEQKVPTIYIQYDEQDKIKSAEFGINCFFCRTRYVYEPNYTLPADDPGELYHYGINKDWYRVEEDWN